MKNEPESVEAWQLLGTSQAENEQDPQVLPTSQNNKCRRIGLSAGY